MTSSHKGDQDVHSWSRLAVLNFKALCILNIGSRYCKIRILMWIFIYPTEMNRNRNEVLTWLIISNTSNHLAFFVMFLHIRTFLRNLPCATPINWPFCHKAASRFRHQEAPEPSQTTWTYCNMKWTLSKSWYYSYFDESKFNNYFLPGHFWAELIYHCLLAA